MRITSILIAFLAFSAGAYSAESPLAQESRPVKAVTDPKKTVTVPEGMVWYDASPPTRGLRFPAGTYVLEAEDSDYLYFRSSAPLEMRVFNEATLRSLLTAAGFQSIRIAGESCPQFGILPDNPWSLPIAARKGRV